MGLSSCRWSSRLGEAAVDMVISFFTFVTSTYSMLTHASFSCFSDPTYFTWASHTILWLPQTGCHQQLLQLLLQALPHLTQLDMALIFQPQLLMGSVSSSFRAQSPALLENLHGDPVGIPVKSIKEELPPRFIILNKIVYYVHILRF